MTIQTNEDGLSWDDHGWQSASVMTLPDVPADATLVYAADDRMFEFAFADGVYIVFQSHPLSGGGVIWTGAPNPPPDLSEDDPYVPDPYDPNDPDNDPDDAPTTLSHHHHWHHAKHHHWHHHDLHL